MTEDGRLKQNKSNYCNACVKNKKRIHDLLVSALMLSQPFCFLPIMSFETRG